jgi:hypothetical protein
MSKVEFKNNVSVEEALLVLKKEGVKVLKDSVVCYVPYREPVSEDPNELIGIETEEDMLAEWAMLFIDVIAVGPDVKEVSTYNKVYLTPDMMYSVVNFTVGGLKYQMFPEKVIRIIKSI